MTAKGVRKRNSNGLRAQLGSSYKAGPGEKEERRQSENTVMETEGERFRDPKSKRGRTVPKEERKGKVKK